MTIAYTDVTIVIGIPEGEDNILLEAEVVDEDNGNPSHYLPNERYLLRLYKSTNIQSIISRCNFGSVGATGSTVTPDIPEEGEDEEFLIFNGNDSASLNKPYKSDMSLTQIGRVYDKTGEIFNPTLSYTEGLKEVIADKEIYGVFQVTYKTEYTQYYFQADRTGKMLIFFIGNTEA